MDLKAPHLAREHNRAAPVRPELLESQKWVENKSMTREEIAKRIRWPFIIWAIGIINPFFMVPQLCLIWRSGHTEGVSILSLAIILVIQTGFALHGFFMRDKPLMLSNAAAAVVSLATTISVLVLRS